MKTAKVDNKKRIRIPDAKPGMVYAYERGPAGLITLRELMVRLFKSSKPVATIRTIAKIESSRAARPPHQSGTQKKAEPVAGSRRGQNQNPGQRRGTHRTAAGSKQTQSTR